MSNRHIVIFWIRILTHKFIIENEKQDDRKKKLSTFKN